MKTTNILYTVLAGCFCALPPASGASLQIIRSGTTLQISFDTKAGEEYQLEASPDLQNWTEIGVALQGDGNPGSQTVPVDSGPHGFYRLAIAELPPDLAPTADQFREQVVGTTVVEYEFLSANRFLWVNPSGPDEPGNWGYTKTGPNTGLMVFTYDEDNNDPGVYREEIVLTFSTPTSGMARYSEYYGSVEYAGSVWTFPFDLGG